MSQSIVLPDQASVLKHLRELHSALDWNNVEGALLAPSGLDVNVGVRLEIVEPTSQWPRFVVNAEAKNFLMQPRLPEQVSFEHTRSKCYKDQLEVALAYVEKGYGGELLLIHEPYEYANQMVSIRLSFKRFPGRITLPQLQSAAEFSRLMHCFAPPQTLRSASD
jgi:hypothetical protein